jgi:hypothetical protein
MLLAGGIKDQAIDDGSQSRDVSRRKIKGAKKVRENR